MSKNDEIRRRLGLGMPRGPHSMADMQFSIRKIDSAYTERERYRIAVDALRKTYGLPPVDWAAEV